MADQSPADIAELFLARQGRPLVEEFRETFGIDLPEDAGRTHRMVIVAAELDDASERIIRYLQNEHEVNINAVFFSVYRSEGRELLVRAWLADPDETRGRTTDSKCIRPRWSGVWYVNHTEDRDWEKRRDYGYVSAGNGERYSRPLLNLDTGDTIAVYQKQRGYLGVGTVRTPAVTAAEYLLPDKRPIADIEPGFARREPGREEFVVGVDWVKTVGVVDAQRSPACSPIKTSSANCVTRRRSHSWWTSLNFEFRSPPTPPCKGVRLQ